jgi:hypothetical protein
MTFWTGILFCEAPFSDFFNMLHHWLASPPDLVLNVNKSSEPVYIVKK